MKNLELRKGYIINLQFGTFMGTIDTKEKAGIYQFSSDIRKNELGGYSVVNGFYAKLSFAKKWENFGNDLNNFQHLRYEKLEDEWIAILEQ